MTEEPRKITDARLASGGFNGFTPLNWVRESGGKPTGALAAWERGELAELPVGKGWDVVRLPRAIGWKVVAHMRAADLAVGPAQHTPDGVDVLVPVGSAAEWHLPDSEVLTEGALVAVPHPATVAPHTLRAHSWIVSPRDGGPLTDADMLHESYAAVLAALHMEGAR
ncbi:hypothetical protein ACGFWE_14035 [Streptomyces sp. NPDC048523]|uniref:hypothetical protein n=1 Tax=Streptomyces sp. NPDC048523 TaxID=3365567 RepID=UPI0037249ABE